ncbi:MAG: exo-alpha-sialidase [Planctomycetes bacterium]|nr:exo-alpha-sialidase [Planctomycetota bacterium]
MTLDGQEIISAQDERYADGVIGLYASQGHVAFRNLKVSGAPARKEWKLVPKPYQIVCSDGGGGAYEAFPDLCRLKNGDLLCVFYEGYGHVSLPNEQLPKGGRVCSVRSSDEGRTWGKAEIVADTPFDDRDPHICQLSDGTLICNFFSYYAKGKRREGSPHPFEILTTRSTDGGHTWSEPQLVEINSPLAWACSAPIRELPDKSLIMGIYHESGAVAFGGTIKSYDRGKTWTDLAHIGEGSGVYLDAETDVALLSDGRLLAALRSSKQDMHYAHSSDLGKTWSPVKSFGFKGHAPYFLKTSTGILLLAHRVPSTALHYSLDEGQTWSDPVVIDSVGGAYPAMAELSDGTIYCVYYEEGPGSNIRARRFRATKAGIEFLRPLDLKSERSPNSPSPK